MGRRLRAGRGVSRPVVVSSLAVAGLLGFVLWTNGVASRGPIAVANRDATPPTETFDGSIRRVRALGAPESLVVDSSVPTGSARLLFYEGRPVQPGPDGVGFAVDGGGDVIGVDQELRLTRIELEIEGRDAASVAPAADGGLWIVTGDGEILRTNPEGDLIMTTTGEFTYSLVATDSRGLPWLVRSPDRTTFIAAVAPIPLLEQIGEDGHQLKTLGSGVVPPDFMLAHLASAGRIAIADSIVYYAPFIRDEVVALSMTGDTLWITSRGLPQAVDTPTFEVSGGEALVDYAPVNLGISVGMDGNIYVLSIPGFTTSESRLDVLDPETGHLFRSTTLATPLPTLAADAAGRVHLIDEVSLLTGVAAKERQTFKAFDLERMRGGRMTSDDLRGSVTLINFWASWCAPCRIEMPALDSLRLELEASTSDFKFVTMNEDIAPANAAEFIDEYGFDFPVLLGRAKLKQDYHYIGLPFTILLDRDGKVMMRWIGYAGEEQLADIRALALAELSKGMSGVSGVSGVSDDTASVDHSHH